MDTNELLTKAREAFIKDYAQTPEKAGFKVIKCYKKEVIFAKDEQVLTALQKSQKLIKAGLNTLLAIVSIWVVGLILAFTMMDNTSAGNFVFLTILIGLAIFFTFGFSIQFRCNKLEAIYLKENCHLIYNGKRFYAIKNEPVNPHAAFF